jgi:hypothetical protein
LVPTRENASPGAFFNFLIHKAVEGGWTFDWTAALEYWGDLARTGMIALLGGGEARHGQALFILTAHGHRVLSAQAPSPSDRSGFMAALRRRAPSADPISLVYLEEALGAWHAGLFRATVVMAGCACERLILALAETVRDVSIVPFSEKIAKMLAPPKPAGASLIFEQVRGALAAVAEDGRVAGDLADALDRKLTSTFEHTRGLRNRSGHPTGDAVSAEEALGVLTLFGDYCAFATGWRDALMKLT